MHATEIAQRLYGLINKVGKENPYVLLRNQEIKKWNIFVM